MLAARVMLAAEVYSMAAQSKRSVGKKAGARKTVEKGPVPTAPEIASRGGNARARALTDERKSEIAKKGALARWRDKPIKAERTGTLRLGSAEVPCANLPDGRRVLSETAILSALGRGYSGYYSQRDAASGGDSAKSTHRSVSPAVLSDFIPAALADMLAQPIAYLPPGTGPGTGVVSKGIPAEALPMILDVWIAARDAGVLNPRQKQTADRAEILRRGLTNVAIVALVDEATGAQYDRARFALARFLESFVTKELAAWEKMFEDDFYKEMFRLRKWNEANFMNRPGVVGKWTTDIVYKRLAPGVLQRLQEIIPRDSKGRLKFRFHQALTRDKGYLALKEHLASVTTIMKLADSWEWFMSKLDRVHPKLDSQLLLPFIVNEGDGREHDEEEDDGSVVTAKS
ncbi:P63C domain-containing protein [Sorangium sp. So ce260]|uniref:P63C domain-containing protein n=1 Tax=Sorangium sp. So ce260 TaxID=3133291 RepID=UPI003F629E1F